MMFDRIRRFLLFLSGLVLPQEHLNLAIGGFGGALTPNKMVNGVLLAFAATAWAVRGRTLPRNPKNMLVAFFATSVAISSIGSILQGTAVTQIIGVGGTWVALLLFYAVMASMVQASRDMDLIIMGVALGTVIVAGSAALGIGVSTETRFGTRGGGLGGNANMLAFNACLGIPLFAAMILSRKDLIPRLFYLGATMSALVGIVFSLSRSGVLALGSIAAMWMVRQRRAQYILPVMVLGAGFLLIAPDGWFERVGTISLDRGNMDSSAAARLEAIPQMAVAFISSPLVGIGFVRFKAFAYEAGFSQAHVIHNAFAEVLVEQGLLGFIPFIMIHFMAWRDFTRSWRLAKRLGMHGDPELQALGLRATMLQISFFGMIVMAIFQPSHANKGLWLVLALSTAVWHLTKQAAARVQAAAAVESAEAPASPLAPGPLAPGTARVPLQSGS